MNQQQPAQTLPDEAIAPGAHAASAATPRWLDGRRVLVLGLGDSGLAMARWCVGLGAEVTVWDSREQPPQAAALRAELPQVSLRLGEALGDTPPEGLHMLLKSPGLSPHDTRIAPLLAAARAAALPVWGELDLFARALADQRAADGYAPQLLAITGTNGKTTTTALTTLLVQRAGRRAQAAGNIGPTLLDTLAATLVLPLDERPEVWVLELSSFQLEGGGFGVSSFEPDAAVVLNITQDHLDWHGCFADYAAAKGRVFGARTLAVINRDDAVVEALLPAAEPQAPATSAAVKKGKATKAEPAAPARAVLRFGLTAPRAAGDFGLVEENGIAWLVRAMPDDDEPPARPRRGAAPPPQLFHLQRLMPADAMRLRGRHNAANAMAALALASAIGCPLAPMLHGLREYSGEPHRLQWLADLAGVAAYDDSKGTNVGATVAALAGLGADIAPARQVLILGGDGKGQDFAPLVEPLRQHARAVALIGRDAPILDELLQQALPALPRQRHATLEDAVAWCFAQAQPGDAVLLSPACSSLDMFSGYAQRGQRFAEAISALAADRGQL